jgi:hypothetical protein
MDPNHPGSRGEQEPGDAEAGPGRPVELVAGDFLLTVNPVDGCEIASCPPVRRPSSPRPRRTREPGPSGGPRWLPPTPLLERDEERHRLSRLLARGRSARLTGAPGAGRTALLAVVARECAELAPDGVIRLNGHRRTANDLLHELYAAVHEAPRYRPGAPELAAALREIGAVVLVDDIGFGGAALDELLDATPECAFLVSAHPGVAAPASGSRLEEVFLRGLSRTACMELLERTAGRPLGEAETDWAADLWLATEGLPLRFTQAGSLLRQRGDADGEGDGDGLPDAASLAASLAIGLSEPAQEILRFALALGGELPDPARLPALTGDPRAAAAHAELLGSGLVTSAGDRRRISAATATELAAASDFSEGAPARALTAAQHYTWWLTEPSATPGERAGRAAAEADALLAAAQSAQRGGHAAAVAGLARAAAPLFAEVTPRWGAWERMLRSGAEAARVAGDVAQQAYFQHELGVLAICQGRLERARAELEAATALRGVLSDAGGAVAGRRALALVADLSRPAARPAARPTPPLGVSAAAPAPAPAVPAPAPPAGAEDVTQAIPRQPQPQPTPQPQPEPEPPARRVVAGARRNAVAAGAGVLLVAAVLGTVVAMGLASDQSEDPENGRQADPAVTDPEPTPTTPTGSPSSPAEDTGREQTPTRPPTSGSGSETPDPSTELPTTPTTPTTPTSPTDPPTTTPDPTSPSPTPTPTDPTSPGTPTESDSGGSSDGGGTSEGTSEGTSSGSGGTGGTDEGTDQGTSEGATGESEGTAGGTNGEPSGTPTDTTSATPSPTAIATATVTATDADSPVAQNSRSLSSSMPRSAS